MKDVERGAWSVERNNNDARSANDWRSRNDDRRSNDKNRAVKLKDER